MKKWIVEDWEFEITVTKASPCRMGFEVGDISPANMSVLPDSALKRCQIFIHYVKFQDSEVTISCVAAKEKMKWISVARMDALNFILLQNILIPSRKNKEIEHGMYYDSYIVLMRFIF